MCLCDINESETSDCLGNNSRYVLVGVSLPIWHWRNTDREVEAIEHLYELANAEIHTAWLLRKHLEKSRIMGLEDLGWKERKSEVMSARTNYLLQLQRSRKHKS